MRIDLSGDYYEDCGISSLLNKLYGNLSEFFRNKNYGDNDIEIFIVIICAPERLRLRKRFDKKEKVLYYDVILNYESVKSVKQNLKKIVLAKAIIESFDTLDQYHFNIDKIRLKEDAKLFFESIGWMVSMKIVK